MNSIKSKVAYLQGVIEDLTLDKGSKEGRAITEILKVLNDIAKKIDELEENQNNLEEYVDTLDFQLQDVEEDFYGSENYEDSIEEDDFIEFQCPRCLEIIYIDKSIVLNKEKVKCPNCNFDLMDENLQKFND